jgi:hypothetical protein
LDSESDAHGAKAEDERSKDVRKYEQGRKKEKHCKQQMLNTMME